MQGSGPTSASAKKIWTVHFADSLVLWQSQTFHTFSLSGPRKLVHERLLLR